MRYRSPFIEVRDLLRHIADVATGGDMGAAWDELLAAAADGAITAYGNDQTGSHVVISNGPGLRCGVARAGSRLGGA